MLISDICFVLLFMELSGRNGFLFCKITSKHDRNSYCLNSLHSFRTGNKLKEHENVCKNRYYCCIEMPREQKNILEYDHGEKSMKTPFIIYADMESLNLKSHLQLK